MIETWIKQKDTCITTVCNGSTLLIKLKDVCEGITANSGATVDISWLRSKNSIHATTGNFKPEDIEEWVEI